MVHVDVVAVSIVNHDVITFHGNFWQSCVFESEDSGQEKRVNKVAVVIEQLQLYSQIPSQLTLNDAKAFSVCSARLF